jgi:putative ABC transport system substrate-binding protein
MPVLVTGPEEFETAFARMVKEEVAGMIVQPLFVGHRDGLAQLALRHQLPMIADQPSFARAGALASYGVNRRVLFRKLSAYVDKVLKGANPAEMPVELPTSFELVINLKTAKALGLSVAQILLARADEVIE